MTSDPHVLNDPFRMQRDVDFFLRLHRHLPDDYCGSSPLGACNYRPDGEPINAMNERIDDLRKDPAFIVKEEEVKATVEAKWKEWGRI